MPQGTGLMAATIKEAKALDKKYNFFISINENAEGAVPVAVKDNICVKGMLTTAGSKILHNYYPVFDATVIVKLKKAGCAIIGKTAMDEFGFGTFSTNCAYKIPKNPHDPKRSCGGSSGGAAGYIAASKYCRFAIGQSTGGSITCPAAFCGVVGLTPTYGLVSRYGLIDYANSMDKIGILAKTVNDAAHWLNVIAGRDKKDSTTALAGSQLALAAHCAESSNKRLRIGVPKEYFRLENEDILEKIWRTIKKLEQQGYDYIEVSLPHTKYALPTYYIIALSEASTNLAKFCGMRYGLNCSPEHKGFNEYFSEIRTSGFGIEAKRRIILGTFSRMVGFREQYYLKAMKIRTLVINDFKAAFKKVDVLAAPSMPMVAPKFSEIEQFKPIDHYMSDILTVPSNLAGIPQLSVPSGTLNGMPIGIQFLADHFQEQKIIQIGREVEKYAR